MLNSLKNTFYILISFFLFSVPTISYAHVKWFVDEHSKEGVAPNLFQSPLLGPWVILMIVAVLFFYFLEKKLPPQTKDKTYKINSLKPKIISFFGVFVGLFFILASLSGFIFSENLKNLGTLSNTLLSIEAIIGISFLIGLGVRFFSVVLFLLWLFVAFYLGLLNALEALWVPAISFLLIVWGRPSFHPLRQVDIPALKFTKYKEYTIPALRVLIGIDLILLGFTEKLLNPGLGLAFLDKFSWNFMQNIFGIEWYSNYLFVMSAGFVEVMLGLIFILGLATRINTLITMIIFTIPLFFMGPVELVGHMPHFIIVLILLIFGSENKFKLVKAKK